METHACNWSQNYLPNESRQVSRKCYRWLIDLLLASKRLVLLVQKSADPDPLPRDEVLLMLPHQTVIQDRLEFSGAVADHPDQACRARVECDRRETFQTAPQSDN